MLLLDGVVSVAAVIVVVVVIVAVLGLPRHFILLFEASSGVGEPRGHLGQGHLGDDGQHDLLTFGRVRVLLVLRKPRLERRRRLPRRVLPPRCQIVTRSVTATDQKSPKISSGSVPNQLTLRLTPVLLIPTPPSATGGMIPAAAYPQTFVYSAPGLVSTTSTWFVLARLNSFYQRFCLRLFMSSPASSACGFPPEEKSLV